MKFFFITRFYQQFVWLLIKKNLFIIFKYCLIGTVFAIQMQTYMLLAIQIQNFKVYVTYFLLMFIGWFYLREITKINNAYKIIAIIEFEIFCVANDSIVNIRAIFIAASIGVL